MSLWEAAEERQQFLRQTRSIGEKWACELDEIRAQCEPGKKHFTVIDGLSRSDSPLVRTLPVNQR